MENVDAMTRKSVPFVLPFLDDVDLLDITTTIFFKVEELKKDVDIHKNTIDPFSAIFDAMLNGISLEEWMAQEKMRQTQKSLQNTLGTFHEEIIGAMNGWERLKVGNIFDVINREKKIVAEIKNKHNTAKGNHRMNIYDDATSLLNEKYKGHTAYYVEIIPKNNSRYDKPFTPSDNRTGGRRPVNESIRVIDGMSFYTLASGYENALAMLYQKLPDVIASLAKVDAGRYTNSVLFEELFKRAY